MLHILVTYKDRMKYKKWKNGIVLFTGELKILRGSIFPCRKVTPPLSDNFFAGGTLNISSNMLPYNLAMCINKPFHSCKMKVFYVFQFSDVFGRTGAPSLSLKNKNF